MYILSEGVMYIETWRQDKMFQENVERGSRVVVISANEATGPFTTRLYVNCKLSVQGTPVLISGTATLLHKKAKTIQGARKQASNMLELH